MASKVEKGSSASESASSWVPGVPDWFVMQNKPRELPVRGDVVNLGRMIRPPMVAPNNWVLLKHPKTREPDMVPVISRSQRRKIQRRYTQYQKDLKESGGNSSPVKTEGRKNPKSGYAPKPVPQSKVVCSREQLVKVHSELKTREKASLVGLEKALMETDSETEEEISISQKKEIVEEEMFEAFMAEQTFLTEEPVEKDPSKGSISNEIPECIMQDVSEGVNQSNQEGEQEFQAEDENQEGQEVDPVQISSEDLQASMEFQAGDENQEGQEADPVQISSEDSQASMVQDNFEMVTPMEDEYESEEVRLSLEITMMPGYRQREEPQEAKSLALIRFSALDIKAIVQKVQEQEREAMIIGCKQQKQQTRVLTLVVYPYVPIDQRRSLEENLLVAWYTSSMPTKIMPAIRRSEEAQGYNPSFLAKKAKICSSDWLAYINAFVPSAPAPSPIMEASTPSSPLFEAEPSTPSPPPTLSWTEKLRLALPMDKGLCPQPSCPSRASFVFGPTSSAPLLASEFHGHHAIFRPTFVSANSGPV
ncbi:uncharacterized protein LOC114304287 [Camellia sinensis]|uniref:uncharacterized protein LOC114304287 n=1 Tax=Camellia sinensis TaxID=4442 RepID=UPI001036D9F7|nr:uncharacterized protein LOC114304287 [Camellia sinensis]